MVETVESDDLDWLASSDGEHDVERQPQDDQVRDAAWNGSAISVETNVNVNLEEIAMIGAYPPLLLTGNPMGSENGYIQIQIHL